MNYSTASVLPGTSTEADPIFTTNTTSTAVPAPNLNSNPIDHPLPTQAAQEPAVDTPSAPLSQPTAQKTILLLNGPNLNLLGHREPGIYGHTTLHDIETHLTSLATTRGVKLLTFQSNHEGALVDRIHEAFYANLKHSGSQTQSAGAGAVADSSGPGHGTVDGIIINPGAYTHTSVAIRDALSGVSIPFVECHISNVHAREEFRHKSFLSDKAEAVIAGLGVFGYVAALDWWCWKWKGANMADAGK